MVNMRTIVFFIASVAVFGASLPRVLTTDLEVNAPLEKVWKAWTTPEGVKTFFAPGCHIEPHVDGAYEILFSPNAKPGERGTEGMRILAFEPMRRLAFTWNAPPKYPEIRAQRTMVIVEFNVVHANRTLVRFTHTGWGEGRDWDEVYVYFDHAWNEVVLPRFRQAMEVGPLDWNKTPQLEPVARTLQAGRTN
jgi:uncharacterized protein YndB with AHSA1/START domain